MSATQHTAEQVTGESPQGADSVSPVGGFDTPGARLRAAREAGGHSVGDIAARLRMGAKQIQALESGHYEVLPKGTFLRGFVRNYANAVALDPGELLALLERTHAQARPVRATDVVEPARQGTNVREPAGMFASPKSQAVAIALVGFALTAAFAYWWTQVRGVPVVSHTIVSAASFKGEDGRIYAVTETRSGPGPISDQQKPAPAEAGMAPQPLPGIGGLSAAPPEVAVGQAVPVTGLALAPAAPPPSRPNDDDPATAAASTRAKPNASTASVTAEPVSKPRATGTSQVGFTFTGESWVEVADVNGRVVLSKRFKAGEADEVSGKPPLSITVGNASVTRMAVNGREFDLAPHTRGAVARVTAR